jgi:hypothetical protein
VGRGGMDVCECMTKKSFGGGLKVY